MIEISSLDHSGRGIGRLNNKIVFVENALPGEIVEIKVLKEKKNFIEASVLNYIKRSENRVESPCKYFNLCGGCDIMHISYNDQLKFKQNKVENIIKKYLGEDIKINKIVKSDNIFNYRGKTTFQVKGKIGFYKNKTYELIQIDKCLISDNIVNNAIKHLKLLDLSKIEKIICRTGSNELMVIIESKKEDIDISAIKDISSSIYIKNDCKYKLVYGKEYITEKIGPYKFLVSPDSFFQVNINVCEKLYSKIKDYVGTNKNVLDLYCGTGSIGIFVSKDNNVLGIEINKSAIEDAKKNADINHVNNIKFICGDSGKSIENLNFKSDVIIVDPPRSGLSSKTINNILKFDCDKLIYVSCDPMTLARDLNILKNKFKINEITPFDMFPNTHHVECLTYMSKK